MALKQMIHIVCVTVFTMATASFLPAQNCGDHAMSGSNSAKNKMSITGCVQQGTEKGGYYLTDENGKTWELTGSATKVSPHLGHKVTLTGMSTKASEAMEAKKESHEKQEAGENTHAGDFKVTSVKMISDSCNQ